MFRQLQNKITCFFIRNTVICNTAIRLKFDSKLEVYGRINIANKRLAEYTPLLQNLDINDEKQYLIPPFYRHSSPIFTGKSLSPPP